MSLHEMVREATGAQAAERVEVIQSLWSGYGEIVRYRLHGAASESAILKHVVFPSRVHHPRGWHNDRSHRRKVRSYEVEMAWYHDFAARCDVRCRVPHCHASATIGEDHLMVLEDLDASGFPLRVQSPDLEQIRACLSWLAHFHAVFVGERPDGLWPVGTYWHLATRPDELAAMQATGDNAALRDAAPVIDSMLSTARFQTLVHGDAKLANFCFAKDATADGIHVAAVDFQYVGGGCGIRDVAYFLGSCLDDRENERHEAMLLEHYFAELARALAKRGRESEAAALEHEWRALMPVAQADFYRFLVGWMPTHRKINDYSKRVTMQVLRSL